MLNLHHLAVFHAVATESSVTRGAERLAISQPAVSKQLRELERRLKTTLLDRHPKGVRLTAAGATLAEYARRIFALSDEAERAIEDLSGLRRGKLAVGAGPTVGVYLLPRVLVQFRHRFPDVRVHLETEGPDLLRQRLLDGILDLAITENKLDGAGLETAVLINDVLVPIVAPGNKFWGKKNIGASEFCRQPFIARDTETGNRSLVERTLEARGLSVNPVLTVGSTEAIKQAVIAGLGVAMVSRLAIRAEVAAKQLAELRVKGLSIRYPIYRVGLRGRSESKAAGSFLQTLRDLAIRTD